MWTQFKDLLLLVVGFVLSILGAIIGAWLQRLVDRRIERRPLNQLLNFGKDELLFVFPHRTDCPPRAGEIGAILPRTSTEDFMAMNNFISALIHLGWARRTGVRDTTRLQPEDRKRNLVIICSPKSNALAGAFQDQLEQRRARAYFFRKVAEHWSLEDPIDKDRPPYESPSWKQEAEYVESGVDRSDLPSKAFTDYAIVLKSENPWNPSNRVVWVAGLRGIGTWGAAECVKKHWREIYDKLPGGAKDVDFSALIKVQYDNCDITHTEVQRVILLEGR